MKRNQKTDERIHVRKRVAGGTTGAVLGAVVAGPVGALVGGVVGAVVGRAAERGELPKLNPPASAKGRKSVNQVKSTPRKTARRAVGKVESAANSRKRNSQPGSKVARAKSSRKR